MTRTPTSEDRPKLDDWLPDAIVVRDLQNIIESRGIARIELDSGPIVIPSESNYEVVLKSWREVRFDIGFGNCFGVLVAIGGVSRVESGIIEAKHCFCTLWYSSKRELITTDFSTNMPM